ncbi:MAG: (Fe-S)-binding protein [Anaerolineae bacterium]
MSQSTDLPTALFVTCLVDLYRPEVGKATVALLEQQGLAVEFPLEQTCCGALAHQAGWRPEALTLARRWVEIFEPFEADRLALAGLRGPRAPGGSAPAG